MSLSSGTMSAPPGDLDGRSNPAIEIGGRSAPDRRLYGVRVDHRSDDAAAETLRDAGAPIDAADNSGRCPASFWPQRGDARRRANRDSISVPLGSGRGHDADGSA